MRHLQYMTSSAPLCATTAPITPGFRTHLMQWALVISLLLHGGAALVVIIFSGFSTSGIRSTNLTIQNIDLSPSITAPAQPLSAPPDQQQAMAAPSPQVLEAEKLVQEPTVTTQPPETENSGKEGGVMSTPLGLGMTHGYFSGLADGKTLREDIRSYYFEMVDRINREWWEKAGALKEPLRGDGVFELLVQRDGAITSVRILRGTGSQEADRLVTEIIRNASPLPALPPAYELEQFRAPLRIKAPLFLFRLTN